MGNVLKLPSSITAEHVEHYDNFVDELQAGLDAVSDSSNWWHVQGFVEHASLYLSSDVWEFNPERDNRLIENILHWVHIDHLMLIEGKTVKTTWTLGVPRLEKADNPVADILNCAKNDAVDWVRERDRLLGESVETNG